MRSNHDDLDTLSLTRIPHAQPPPPPEPSPVNLRPPQLRPVTRLQSGLGRPRGETKSPSLSMRRLLKPS